MKFDFFLGRNAYRGLKIEFIGFYFILSPELGISEKLCLFCKSEVIYISNETRNTYFNVPIYLNV